MEPNDKQPLQQLEQLEQAKSFVQEQLGKDASGHDWWHIARVTRLAKQLAKEEQANEFVCELAALLHDVADEKLNPSAEAGLSKVRAWLMAHHVENDAANQVMEIIATISFKGGNQPPVTTKEAQVVQDADRLDALGAIGIARTFAYAGWKGHAMYDPELPYREQLTQEAYRNGATSAVNHFYEKLLLLKDRMNTASGRQLAERRHQVMEQFLRQFYAEWDGTDADAGEARDQ
ncbi:HD domain-containing protein [Paenibacillus rigui]|uniref:Phosphohydrolase n=1 Tax=Paenibacillus rigui TaxID=554312 RepID=A0A229UT10_9BACL|nr:HD domain-containing protein [Paenibacillus rigui]OXM86767.1 phosphohydrolase [Paenibacillus rigui]